MASDEWPFAFAAFACAPIACAAFAFASGKLGKPFAFALGKREARRDTPLPPFNRNAQRLETKDVEGFDSF